MSISIWWHKTARFLLLSALRMNHGCLVSHAEVH